jgi:glyoxylate reductase
MSDREVAVLSPLPGRAVEQLEEKYRVRVHQGPALMDEDGVAAFVDNSDAALTLLANPVTAKVLSTCPSLRVVGNCAVGFDNIDLEAARQHGVWVTNTPDVLTEATADLTWALILAVTRRVVEADRFLREGRFEGWELDLMLGCGLQGEGLGVVGFGRIGRAVARRAHAFGMEVLCADPEPVNDAEVPVRQLPLEELLPLSRVLSLHCPLTPATHHLIDERRLRLLPRGAYVINTSRGPVVDEAALVQVLADGHLAGAGLDVFEHEPEVHAGLKGRDDVVLLPHIGSATLQTRAAMAELAAANIIAVLEGDEPPTAVVRGR